MSMQVEPSEPSQTGHRPAAKTTVCVVGDARGLEPYVPAWEKLCREALEPNVYYEPWMVLPALRYLIDDRRLAFVLVSQKDGQLIGFFPMVRENRFHGLPVRTLGTWGHDYSFLRTPLVHADHAREAIEALLDWSGSAAGAPLLHLEQVRSDGPFHHVLTDVLEARGDTYVPLERRTRGYYTPRESADAYLTETFSGEERRRLKSKERQLQGHGTTAYVAMANDEEEVERWTEEFLHLEASGWKGRERTAMASHHADRRFFETVIAEGAKRSQVEMLALRLDDRAVAMKCNLKAGDGAYVFKIAYDEKYGRQSPGMLLELEDVRRMHATRSPKWMDSCSNPKSRHFGDICNSRMAIESSLVAAGGEGGRLLASLFPLAQWVSRQARRLRGQRQSEG